MSRVYIEVVLILTLILFVVGVGIVTIYKAWKGDLDE